MSHPTELDRFRVLVDAGIALSSELSLDALLQRIVETAAELTGARYGALGVIDNQGQALERFLTTGAGFLYRDTWAISRDEHGWSTAPDRSRPIPPVNPPGARIEGHDVDGIMVADMRRGSERFGWPPDFTTYPREALSGRVIQAEIIHRLGSDPFAWGDEALRRIAVRLIALEAETGDDWHEADQAPMWILRERYPAADLEVGEPVVGRMIAGTDWTHPGAP